MLALVALLLASTPCPQGEPLEGGQHTRLSTERGAIHLWCDAETELRAVVIYVHGYGDDVDSAFTNHQLAAQFAKSNVEALFISVAAPSGPEGQVAFEELDSLLAQVSKHVGAPLPETVVLLGHSGGYRTLKLWLSSTRVQEVVLLDGFYGDSAPWSQWLINRPSATLRLIGLETWDKAEAWRVGLPETVRGRVNHTPAKCPHMEIITQGEWLPRVLRESSSLSPRGEKEPFEGGADQPLSTTIGTSLAWRITVEN